MKELNILASKALTNNTAKEALINTMDITEIVCSLEVKVLITKLYNRTYKNGNKQLPFSNTVASMVSRLLPKVKVNGLPDNTYTYIFAVNFGKNIKVIDGNIVCTKMNDTTETLTPKAFVRKLDKWVNRYSPLEDGTIIKSLVKTSDAEREQAIIDFLLPSSMVKYTITKGAENIKQAYNSLFSKQLYTCVRENDVEYYKIYDAIGASLFHSSTSIGDFKVLIYEDENGKKWYDRRYASNGLVNSKCKNILEDMGYRCAMTHCETIKMPIDLTKLDIHTAKARKGEKRYVNINFMDVLKYVHENADGVYFLANKLVRDEEFDILNSVKNDVYL